MFWQLSNWDLLRYVLVHDRIILKQGFDRWVKGGYWTCLVHGMDWCDKTNHSAGYIKWMENPKGLAISPETFSPMQLDYQSLWATEFLSISQGFKFFMEYLGHIWSWLRSPVSRSSYTFWVVNNIKQLTTTIDVMNRNDRTLLHRKLKVPGISAVIYSKRENCRQTIRISGPLKRSGWRHLYSHSR